MIKFVAKFKKTEHGSFVAWCPCLPGCRAGGSDEAEVKRNIEKAIHCYLASLDAHASKEDMCELIQA